MNASEKPEASRDEVKRAHAIRRLRVTAWVMDSNFRVPGTTWRFGLDPLLGLVPVAGDLVSLLISFHPLLESRNLGLSRRTQALMAGNLLFDFFLGSIPVVGNVFDFAFKANRRNLRLLGLDDQDEQGSPYDG